MAATSSSFSTIVLPVVAIVATLLAGLVAAWAAYAVGVPRRKLLYRLSMIAPILPSVKGGIADLELRSHDKKLEHPRLLKLQLVGRGSRDVPSNSFDGGQPIQMDVGVHIEAILEVVSEPKSFIAPNAVSDGTMLKIGPSLIGKNQEITYTLLVDGEKPDLTCKASLENVKIQPLRLMSVPTDSLLPLGAAISAAIISAAIGVIWALNGSALFPIPKYVTAKDASGVAFGSVTFATAVTAVITGIVTVIIWRRVRNNAK